MIPYLLLGDLCRDLLISAKALVSLGKVSIAIHHTSFVVRFGLVTIDVSWLRGPRPSHAFLLECSTFSKLISYLACLVFCLVYL